jgi:hypothetical protein
VEDFKDSNHIFIIRTWRETREIGGAPSIWRGEVEHARSGEKVYFEDFGKILIFIKKFLIQPSTMNNISNERKGEANSDGS